MTAIYPPDKVIITAPRIFALVGMLREGEGGGVLLYISYFGMCGANGYGFGDVLV